MLPMDSMRFICWVGDVEEQSVDIFLQVCNRFLTSFLFGLSSNICCVCNIWVTVIRALLRLSPARNMCNEMMLCDSALELYSSPNFQRKLCGRSGTLQERDSACQMLMKYIYEWHSLCIRKLTVDKHGILAHALNVQ